MEPGYYWLKLEEHEPEVVEIVTAAMGIVGMSAYREDSPYSMGRLLRDAHGAQVMIHNDRILAANAQWLLIAKEDV